MLFFKNNDTYKSDIFIISSFDIIHIVVRILDNGTGFSVSNVINESRKLTVKFTVYIDISGSEESINISILSI